MANRFSAPDVPRPERWDRDRYEYERERDHDRDRYSDVRGRFDDDDDDDNDDGHVYVRRGPRPTSRPRDRDDRSSTTMGPSDRDREWDREPPRRFRGGGGRADEESDVVVRERSRERRRVVYDDEPPHGPPRREPPRRIVSPPRWRRPVSPPRHPPRGEVEVDKSRVVFERERYRSPSPAPRRPPVLLRRQSSLDTFDRKPARRYWEQREEEYGPPARRDDHHRLPPYVDIPLPRTKALPPPRGYAEREYADEIQVSDPHRYGDEDFHAYPERVRERETVRTRRRDSRVRRRSRSSSSSSSSSSSGGTALTMRSEYPKKGKTRIPARLVSKRALIDLGYPYVEEGNVIIVQKALGQHNIDDLLKLSDDYKKSELELITARSSAGDLIEERVERRTEIYEGAAALPAPHPAPVAPGNGPIIVDAHPPQQPVEVVKTTVIRDASPSRYTTTSYDNTTSYDTASSYDTYTTTTSSPTVVYDRSREESGHVPVGPVVLAGHRHRHSHGHRHDVYETDDLRSEIRHLEKQLARRERSRHRSRHRSMSRGGEMVRAERLSTGELVLYDEEVELVQEPTRAGPRIEKDKRGRLSISVPRYR
ncbi:hypothetical protein N658DRAFT_508710 [Parathielavia hyrcaniae]|uniref:DUF8035 domain-containing protein n=1 Tax=Parathielavia hyrcaniae TaxID=113614 RepID=A0AAN6PYK1_9PEZI|nr:hypothetical protein N658DRAFT_508710 [Parathielavia hyrcaniae]